MKQQKCLLRSTLSDLNNTKSYSVNSVVDQLFNKCSLKKNKVKVQRNASVEDWYGNSTSMAKNSAKHRREHSSNDQFSAMMNMTDFTPIKIMEVGRKRNSLVIGSSAETVIEKGPYQNNVDSFIDQNFRRSTGSEFGKYVGRK